MLFIFLCHWIPMNHNSSTSLEPGGSGPVVYITASSLGIHKLCINLCSCHVLFPIRTKDTSKSVEGGKKRVCDFIASPPHCVIKSICSFVLFCFWFFKHCFMWIFPMVYFDTPFSWHLRWFVNMQRMTLLNTRLHTKQEFHVLMETSVYLLNFYLREEDFKQT